MDKTHDPQEHVGHPSDLLPVVIVVGAVHMLRVLLRHEGERLLLLLRHRLWAGDDDCGLLGDGGRLLGGGDELALRRRLGRCLGDRDGLDLLLFALEANATAVEFLGEDGTLVVEGVEV